ncbi:MAG: hypothetical protein A2091_12600 [Desulfuromonadales bacterium GWD2_61_12]|nr:MAG: hypothetical protein A2005_11325 [Desulfuromonadales bacterium GWC2_61_20]OGR36523.1 MAG: hypothetical protein A2091_12600 [Desulfuromonadales bacterium GWD2_61_12]HAD05085.1 hypothetical protein [Desulfuromonas sp.]
MILHSAPPPRIFRGLFLLCLATLMYELVLTRVFSVLMWYHFASMAISLALFGMGTAALAVYLKPQWFPAERCEFLCSRFAALFGLSVALFFAVFVLFRLQPQLGFKVLSFFHQPFYQPFQQGFYDRGVPAGLLPVLAVLYLITSLPFFCSGLAITLILSRWLNDINRLYCWDLLGAGAGCLLVIPLLKLCGGITALLVIGLIGLLASWSFMPKETARIHKVGLAGMVLLLALAGVANYLYGFAEIRFVRGRFEPSLLWSEWNSFSRVAVYPTQSQEMDQSWGLSRTYQGPVPEQLGMVVDDTGYTTMYRWEGERTRDFFRANVIALPYALKEQPVSLIIGPGGGKDVLTALAMDAGPVTAVEVNNLIVEAVNDHFGAFTGELYRRPGVTVAVDEGRSYIRRSPVQYDIIQASAVFGRMAPAAGAFTLSENTLYTLEGFRDYWQHLTPDGILTISRFIFERETLRLVSLGLALLKEQGVADPASHLAIIKERGLANFMLKRTPFTTAELAQLRQLAAEREFEIVFLPDRREAAEGVFGKLINSGGSDAFYRTFPFDITPTTDDRPFFYYMFKPADFLRLFAFPQQSQFEDRAVLTLRNLLLVVSGFVVVFICLPLLIWQRAGLSRQGSGRRILYFACLGLGYMLIEIGLMRRFVLFLGPPIYALAIILFSLLVFSGLGSLLSDRVGRGAERAMLVRVLLALLLLSNLYIFGLGPLLGALLTLGELWRCVVAVLLLAPLGLLMGMPMPLGLRLLHADGQLVPWSWGINSATSVLGAIVAVIVAMNFGFIVTLLCGEAIYALALLVVFTTGRQEGRIWGRNL